MFVIIFAICNKIDKLAKNTKVIVQHITMVNWYYIGKMVFGDVLWQNHVVRTLSNGNAIVFLDSPKAM